MKYKIIKLWRDNEYELYNENDLTEPLFMGTLEYINAWISLKEKGYNF